MDEKAILKAACDLSGVSVRDVMSYKVYEDHIALVVYPGPKHKIPLADLPKPKAIRKRGRRPAAVKGIKHEENRKENDKTKE